MSLNFRTLIVFPLFLLLGFLTFEFAPFFHSILFFETSLLFCGVCALEAEGGWDEGIPSFFFLFPRCAPANLFIVPPFFLVGVPLPGLFQNRIKDLVSLPDTNVCLQNGAFFFPPLAFGPLPFVLARTRIALSASAYPELALFVVWNSG